MPRINMLSIDTFSKIAAGEVVEKPSSVVKELIENSIDAKSSNITVEIVNAGLDLIKIVDDGCGIYNEDLEKAFLPHATSKIKEINDIFSIMTLGFRGEALASVSSVSKTLLKSKTEEENDAMEIYLEGGDIRYKKISIQNKGTYIEVRDLFYNVPARFKFLKSIQKESSNINDVMSRLALSHPEIAFDYTNNGKKILKTYGIGNQRDVIRTVYNRKIYENVNYFEKEFDGYKIYGYIGNEEISRGSRNQQSIFINRRYVSSKTITVAVERAYQSFITVSKFPFFVLNIDVDPSKVDVNVHPQKAEVKFEDDKLIFKSVFDTIHASLREVYKTNLGFLNENEDDLENASKDNITIEQYNYQKGIGSKESLINSINVDHKQESFMDSAQFKNNNDTVSHNINKYQSENGDLNKYQKLDTLNNGEVLSENNNLFDIPVDLKSNSYEQENENNFIKNKNEMNNTSEIVYNEKVNHEDIKFPMLTIIGQFNKTYILAQHNDTLYLLDQHACHEKINFEKYMSELKNAHIITQPLLIPGIIDLSLDDYSVYMDNREVFEKSGFIIEEFGDRTLSIREVPYFLGRTSTESYFHEIIDNLKNLGRGTADEVKYMRIATVACKASIKANDELTMDEMKSLVNQLRYLKEPFTCPHGRPTMVRFTLTDIEKMFRRIV